MIEQPAPNQGSPAPPSHSAEQSPDFHRTRTLSLDIEGHRLEVFESDVSGDVLLDGMPIIHGDLSGEGSEPAAWLDLYRYLARCPLLRASSFLLGAVRATLVSVPMV
jgi:hypothetical protein